MVTAITVKEKIQGLIDKSNNTTGNSDTTLTDAVDALVEGYGAGGGKDPVLTELTVTENGVYDKPVTKAEAKIAAGETIWFKEDIALSDDLKNQIKSLFENGSDYTTLYINTAETEGLDINIYEDGGYAITLWHDQNWESAHSYISEEIIAIHGSDPWGIGITAAGWYLVNNQSVTPSEAPAFVIDTESQENINNLTLVNTALFCALVPIDGWDKVTVNVPSIIDVTRLPTTKILDGVVYRLNTEPKLFVYDSYNNGAFNAVDYIAEYNGARTYLHVVDELPEKMEATQQGPGYGEAGVIHIYIIKSTGIGYFFEPNRSEEILPLSQGMFIGEIGWFPDKGIVDSMDGINVDGCYFIPSKYVGMYVHSTEGWDKIAENPPPPSYAVDVSALPTESVETKKVYRIIEENITDVRYYINTGSKTDTIEQAWIDKYGPPLYYAAYYILVDELPPEDSVPPITQDDLIQGAIPTYVSKVTGEAKCYGWGAWWPLEHDLAALYNGEAPPFHGIVYSVNDMVVPGYYALFTKEQNVLGYGIADSDLPVMVYKNEAWVKMVEESPTAEPETPVESGS